MAQVRFGGPRREDGGAFVFENDRAFSCGFGVCRTTQRTEPVSQANLINLDFEFFDIAQMRDSIAAVSETVNTSYRDILQWLNDLEIAFEIKVRAGDIDKSRDLFQKLNIIIPKFAMGRKIISSWYNDYIDRITTLSDLYSDYNAASAKIQTLGIDTSIGGIPENSIKIATKNLARSKAIQSAMTKLLSLDGKIRSSIQSLRFKVDELSSGMLRYGPPNKKTVFNLIEMSAAIKSLGEGDTPLVRIQNELSATINSSLIDYKYNTPAAQAFPPGIGRPPLDPDTPVVDILAKVMIIQRVYMYTTTTAKMVTAIRKYVQARFVNDAIGDNILAIIVDIERNNTPNEFLARLNASARNPNNIYATIDDIQMALSVLSPQDEILRAPIQEALATARATAGV